MHVGALRALGYISAAHVVDDQRHRDGIHERAQFVEDIGLKIDHHVPARGQALRHFEKLSLGASISRRRNINAKGEARSWTDHLLWHHAAHTIDLFAYQSGRIVAANILQGPKHTELGIALDMSIQLKAEAGAICTLSLSFNNDGPLGTIFRYIGDNGTYIARYDDLVNGKEEPIDVSRVAVSMNGIELQDREFIAAIREGREPNSLAQSLETQDGWS